MVEAFFNAFCLDDQWNQIANFTNSSSGDLFGEKAFAFGDYTPCVADGGILSICYLLFVILASVRLGQLCNRSTRKGKVLNKGRQFYRFFLVLFIWAIFLFQLLKDEIFAEGGANETGPLLLQGGQATDGMVGAVDAPPPAAPAYSTVGDLYMLQPMAPFQFFSRALSVLGWGLALVVAAVETSIFTPAGNWMMTFLGLMDLLCQFVKLYVVRMHRYGCVHAQHVCMRACLKVCMNVCTVCMYLFVYVCILMMCAFRNSRRHLLRGSLSL